MAGTLTATTIQNDTSSPPTFRNNSVEIGQLCRAWVNFNGSTAAIRGGFNVSSITKNGTGRYYVNFTTAMANNNYSAIAVQAAGETLVLNENVITTTQFDVVTGTPSFGQYLDSSYVFVAVFSS